MTTARDQMKLIQSELEEVREKIRGLLIEESVLQNLITKLSGEEPGPTQPRKRAASVKPLVLDIMREAGGEGASSAEVAAIVKHRVPDVAKDTVGSILSRLKGDGALVYIGERYYEKQFAPKDPPNPFDSHLRAVS